MFVRFLRESKIAAALLLILRLYLGYKWLTSGWGKITGGGFNASGFLQGAVANASGENPTVQPWWGCAPIRAFRKSATSKAVGIYHNLDPIISQLIRKGNQAGSVACWKSHKLSSYQGTTEWRDENS